MQQTARTTRPRILVLCRIVAVCLQLSMLTSCSSTPSAFPTFESTGLPDGWSPVREIVGGLWIETDGEVVEDVRVVGGTILIDAKDVTLRRVEGVGARVDNLPRGECGTGLVIEDSTFSRGGPGLGEVTEPVIGVGGYTVRNVLVDGVSEGLRVGGADACGGVVVEDSFLRIMPPNACGDWHGDGIQGYDGGHLEVRDTVIEFIETGDCGGTAAFFYPDGQGNTSVDIDGLLVSGGGFPFRLGTPGSVVNLNIVAGSWVYGPVDVASCPALSEWQAQVVELDTAGQPVSVVSIACPG